jgi:hypothetical protein
MSRATLVIRLRREAVRAGRIDDEWRPAIVAFAVVISTVVPG